MSGGAHSASSPAGPASKFRARARATRLNPVSGAVARQARDRRPWVASDTGTLRCVRELSPEVGDSELGGTPSPFTGEGLRRADVAERGASSRPRRAAFVPDSGNARGLPGGRSPYAGRLFTPFGMDDPRGERACPRAASKIRHGYRRETGSARYIRHRCEARRPG
jgi:hypothetical protein